MTRFLISSKVLSILLLFAISPFTQGGVPAPHEFHMTIIDIEYNPESKLLEISQKLFIDDLGRVLDPNDQLELDFESRSNDSPTDHLILEYIKKHFGIDLGAGELALRMVGKELEDDHHTLYVYLEADARELPNSLKLRNSLFVEQFEDQQNMHHFLVKGGKQSVMLNRQRTEAEVKFDQP